MCVRFLGSHCYRDRIGFVRDDFYSYLQPSSAPPILFGISSSIFQPPENAFQMLNKRIPAEYIRNKFPCDVSFLIKRKTFDYFDC